MSWGKAGVVFLSVLAAFYYSRKEEWSSFEFWVVLLLGNILLQTGD